MKFQNISVKRLFGRVAMELVLSMSGITIALFLVTKQIEEHCPELMGDMTDRNTEEFDKEENK